MCALISEMMNGQLGLVRWKVFYKKVQKMKALNTSSAEKMHFSQNFSIKGHFFEVLPLLGFFGPGCILRELFFFAVPILLEPAMSRENNNYNALIKSCERDSKKAQFGRQ